MKTWILPVDGEMCRVVLEKDTLDIWVNGKKVEVAAEFTDDGTVNELSKSNDLKSDPFVYVDYISLSYGNTGCGVLKRGKVSKSAKI